MGAGARRRAVRRQAEELDQVREDSAYWRNLAFEWGGPQRGRTAEQQADYDWCMGMASAVYRQVALLEQGPGSLRVLNRLARVDRDVSAGIRRCVAALRGQGATWAQIGAELGITGEGARRRYGSGS